MAKLWFEGGSWVNLAIPTTDQLANLASILGFFLTIYLLVTTYKIQRAMKYYERRQNLRKNANKILDQLLSCKQSLTLDGVEDRELKREIIELLAVIETYNDVYIGSDKKVISRIRKAIQKETLNNKDISDVDFGIAHLVGRFKSKGVTMDADFYK